MAAGHRNLPFLGGSPILCPALCHLLSPGMAAQNLVQPQAGSRDTGWLLRWCPAPGQTSQAVTSSLCTCGQPLPGASALLSRCLHTGALLLSAAFSRRSCPAIPCHVSCKQHLATLLSPAGSGAQARAAATSAAAFFCTCGLPQPLATCSSSLCPLLGLPLPSGGAPQHHLHSGTLHPGCQGRLTGMQAV